MIQILPMQDKEREENLLKKLLKENDKGRVLVMSEAGEELGIVKLAVREKTLVIFEYSLTAPCDFDNLSMEENFYIDTLMRSAASYGETNHARTIETFDDKYNKFMKSKGFEIDENHAFAPMSLIVHYT